MVEQKVSKRGKAPESGASLVMLHHSPKSIHELPADRKQGHPSWGAIMSETTVAEGGEARSVVDKELRLGLQPAALNATGPER